MKQIELNHWFIKDNRLAISLLRYHVSVEPYQYDDEMVFKATIVDSEQRNLELEFTTLEEIFYFVENCITKCVNEEDIDNLYKKMYSKKIKKKKIYDSSNVIILFPEDIDKAIIEYYNVSDSYRVSTDNILEIENGKPKITYYITTHMLIDGKRKDVTSRLTNGDLKNVFNNYLEDLNYDLVDFKYMGGIHRVGYHFDEDTPYFEGIELRVKRKDKKKRLVKE